MTTGDPTLGVSIASARLAALDAIRPRAYAALNAAERERIATLADRAADEVVLGRWLLRTLTADVLAGRGAAAAGLAESSAANALAESAAAAPTSAATAPTSAATARTSATPTGAPRPEDVVVVSTCPECGQEHGRPTLPGTALLGSVAHSGGLVVAAVARREAWSAIGIDTEPIGAQGLSEPDLRRWTEREARAKARGTGIVRAQQGRRPESTDASDGGPDVAPESLGNWQIMGLQTPGYVTTLALRRAVEASTQPRSP